MIPLAAVVAALVFPQAVPAAQSVVVPAAQVDRADRAAAQAAQPAPPTSDGAARDALKKARAMYEYGDYAEAAKRLAALVEAGRFESVPARAEAYRLLGLSQFYLGHKPEAYRAFLEYLYLEPDAELDPFYFSPAVVSFFDTVKKEAEPRLAPLRAEKRAQEEQRRRQLAEESERRRQRDLEEERKRLLQLQQPVERRVVQKEFWVSLMPFGLGQLQNGDRSLGIALAASQVVAGAASAGSALLIEQLRDPTSGRFDNRNGNQNYVLAQRLSLVKWIGAGVFYGLWAAGAIHAAIRFQPEEQLPDRLLEPPSQPGPQPGSE